MSLSDWTIANPESAGLRSEPLRDLVEWLDGIGQANIHSVLVVRHGRLLFEHYRAGEDQCWGEPLGNVAHGPESKHDLRSVTKSVISLLFGIALDRKLIRDIDEAIIDWFPQYSDLRTPEKERISLRHLLTMSAGLEWNENFLSPIQRIAKCVCFGLPTNIGTCSNNPLWRLEDKSGTTTVVVLCFSRLSLLRRLAGHSMTSRANSCLSPSVSLTSHGRRISRAGFLKWAACDCARGTSQRLASSF